jgi:hypothetical protein
MLEWRAPLKSLIDAGARVVFGTYTHVGPLPDKVDRFAKDWAAGFPYWDSVGRGWAGE